MNKIVFITGASSGIGAACAHKFAQAGYTLLLNARNEEKLHALQAELENKVEKLKIDLTEVNIEPVVNNQVNEVKEQISTPAVAETDCSYLNIIN